MAVARIQVGDLSVGYRKAGEGPPLVLLHGFLCDSRCWRPQLDGLADRFTVIAWDAPGAGVSSDPAEGTTLADWGECLAGFLDGLGVGRAGLVGLSWGGILAQEFYRLYPDRVSGLVLAGTYAGWKGSLTPGECAARLARCERDSLFPPRQLAERWVPEMFSDAAPAALLGELSGIFADFHPPGFRLMARSSAETDTTPALADIRAPTLLLWGGDDRRSPLRIAEQLRRSIAHAQLAVIPGAGHVSNMEQPDAFNDHVRRFCSSLQP